MIQDNLVKQGAIAKNPNAGSTGAQELRSKEERRKNYFERKRWLNYPNNNNKEDAENINN